MKPIFLDSVRSPLVSLLHDSLTSSKQCQAVVQKGHCAPGCNRSAECAVYKVRLNDGHFRRNRFAAYLCRIDRQLHSGAESDEGGSAGHAQANSTYRHKEKHYMTSIGIAVNRLSL
jgi:hypothetical protein